MSRSRIASFVLAAVVLGAGPAIAGEVVLYSSNTVDAINAVTEEFNKKYPDIKISPVRGSTGAMMQRIKAEAGAPKADIFWSGGFSVLRIYKEFFEPYQSPEYASLQGGYKDSTGLWAGTNAHVMVIMVNKRALRGDPMPKTWSDLAHPRWKDRLVVSDPEKTSSSYATLYGIEQALGREPLKGIARNATITSTASQVFDGVAKGEFAVGMTMEYAAQEYVSGGNKDIEIVYPSEGTYIAPEGMALVKKSPNPAEAKKFYDFLASKQAQEMLVKKFFRRPIRDDVDLTAVGLPRTTAFKVAPIDDVKASAAQPAFLASWKELVAAGK
ncbi:MAG: ABC transporter substrate-binding protein [Pseudomonadota bacterium]|nr:ABC transporter substrate-binding protein [Pseudomonadota bacterium]